MKDNFKDNLTLLQEAREGLSRKEFDYFNSLFVGALQSHVDQDLWIKCLDIARDCLRGMRVASSV